MKDELAAISVTPLSAKKRTGSFASSGYPDFAVSMVQNFLMDQHLQNKLPFVKKIRFTGKLQKQDNAENQLLHLAEMWTISIEMLPQ